MTNYTQNYSLPYPEGNDAVAVHTDIEDLAKRLDLVVDAQFGQIDQKFFYRRDLQSSDSLSSLSTGAYSAASGTTAAAIGVPEPSVGTLIVSSRKGATTGVVTVGTALFFSRGTEPKIWVSTVTDGAGTWSNWVELGGGETTFKGQIWPSDNFANLETGVYASHAGGTTRDVLGIPEPGPGTLSLVKSGSNISAPAVGTAFFTVRGTNPKVWVSTVTDGVGTWSEWKLIGGGVTPEAPVTELHAFLVAGQSNMAGHGEPYGEDMDPVDPRILQYGARSRRIEPATVPLNQHRETVGLSIATVFAREYLKNQPAHVGVLLIPAARGASYLKPRPAGDYVWYPGGAAAPEYDLYAQAITQTEEALAADPRATLKGVLWHQGEGNSGDTETEYVGYQDHMINQFRTDLNQPDLPFLVGELVPEGTDNVPGRKPVNVAISKTPARLERTAFSAAERGWAKYQDETHYARIGVERLGKRYLHAYKVALSNTQGSDPTPPDVITARRTATGVTITWVPPYCRVTEYQVEYRADGGTWETVARDNPMYPKEQVPASAVEVRITAVHDTRAATPVVLEV